MKSLMILIAAAVTLANPDISNAAVQTLSAPSGKMQGVVSWTDTHRWLVTPQKAKRITVKFILTNYQVCEASVSIMGRPPLFTAALLNSTFSADYAAGQLYEIVMRPVRGAPKADGLCQFWIDYNLEN